MVLTLEMGTSNLKAKSDSQLVENIVVMGYQVKEPKLIKYLKRLCDLIERLKTFEIMYMPREHNFRADLLSKPPSMKRKEYNCIVIQETLVSQSIEVGDTNGIEVFHTTG